MEWLLRIFIKIENKCKTDKENVGSIQINYCPVD